MSTILASTLSSRAVLARRVAAACGAGVLLLGATSCGSSDPDPATGDAGTRVSADQDGGDATRRTPAPGASGKVAAVSGRTAQVQGDDGQVAVTWTASTTFTQQVAAALTDVEVGSCVMVTSADTGTDSAPEGPEQPTEVTATSVRITEKVDGGCTPTPGGPGVGPRGGVPGDAPTGRPDGAPDGSRPQLRMTGGVLGEVKAVSASGFVVTATRPDQDGDPSSTDVTVTVARSTTYTTTASGSADDVVAGVCVRADGTTDDTGAVTATRIAVTPAVEGECSAGMVRLGRDGDAPTGSQVS